MIKYNNQSQHQKFISKAKELECDKNESNFEKIVKKMSNEKIVKKMSNEKIDNKKSK